MMISAIVRTAIVSLRRDRGALALSFILPVVFFSIFAVIFGGRSRVRQRSKSSSWTRIKAEPRSELSRG